MGFRGIDTLGNCSRFELRGFTLWFELARELETADPLVQYHTTGEGTGFLKTEQFPPGVRESETLNINFISTS